MTRLPIVAALVAFGILPAFAQDAARTDCTQAAAPQPVASPAATQASTPAAPQGRSLKGVPGWDFQPALARGLDLKGAPPKPNC